MKIAAATIALGLLVGPGDLAYSQTPSKTGESALVSPSPENNIKPEPVASSSATTDKDDKDIVADPASLLPDVPKIPSAKATLIGGVIERIDHVRDRLTVRVFGGGRMNVLFDPRSRIYRGTAQASISDLHEGERVYLDTMLDGNTIFARNIHLSTAPALGETQGLVLNYRADRDELTIRDVISPTPIKLRMDSSTRLTQNGRVVSASTLLPGSLIAVRFAPESGSREKASDISILASPGVRYTFAGQVAHLDLRTGLIVLYSSTDRKTYEIYLDPSLAIDDKLQTGAVVTAVTSLDGSRYVAHSVTVDSEAKSEAK
jgi:hypothetical protein